MEDMPTISDGTDCQVARSIAAIMLCCTGSPRESMGTDATDGYDRSQVVILIGPVLFFITAPRMQNDNTSNRGETPENLDRDTIEGFGYEWSQLDQATLGDARAQANV